MNKGLKTDSTFQVDYPLICFILLIIMVGIGIYGDILFNIMEASKILALLLSPLFLIYLPLSIIALIGLVLYLGVFDCWFLMA